MLDKKALPSDVTTSPGGSFSGPMGPFLRMGRHFPRGSDPIGASIHTGRPTKARKSLIPGQISATPEKVLRSFNTWAFKREQPDNLGLLHQIVTDAVQARQPLSFVLYWGKGPRNSIASPDIGCLDFLTGLTRRIGEVHEPGAAVKLIFTDTHARLNGHPSAAMREYFAAIRAAADARGFSGCQLGDLVDAAQAEGVSAASYEAVPKETMQRLGVCAAKWFRGDGSIEQAAATYYQMNMIEKRSVEHAFPGSIFVTFNGSEFRELFPDRMPIFYMYSLKRGMSVKPWFLPAAPAPAELPSAASA